MRVKRRERLLGEGLSPLEIDMMKKAWARGQITVREIHEDLLAGGYIPYTSVMAIMNSLVAKGMLSQDKSNRTYVYKPTMDRIALAVSIIDVVVEKVLDGDIQPVIDHLSSSRKTVEV